MSDEKKLEEQLERLEENNKILENLAFRLERSRINEYLAILDNPRLLIWRNFLSGIAKGIGIAIGFALLGALLIYLLNLVVSWNLPIIGDFIADLLSYVDEARGFAPR